MNDEKPHSTTALSETHPVESIARLQEQLQRAEILLARGPMRDEMKAFRVTLSIAMTEVFGAADERVRVTRKAEIYGDVPERIELQTKITIIKDAIEQLKRIVARRPNVSSPVTPSSLMVVENILRRFHRVAGQLRKRHEDRESLTINDEYDVQDLLHALLLIAFADIRAEETGPSVAGAKPRLDFLLKTEQIVIEIKKTRPTLTTSRLAQELMADIALYQGHPDCKTLVCFVYDPDGQVINVDGFVRDLEATPSKMPVRILVIPG